jgi:uncharacterized protein (TIGR02001 family)
MAAAGRRTVWERTRARGMLACAAWACALIIPVPCHGQGWHGSVAATTDYVFRGLSQTQGDGAVQADLHYEGGGGSWFAGAWASTIDTGFETYGRVEGNAYAGWNWAPGTDWAARASYVRYFYPDAYGGVDYDYGEVSARLAWRDRVVGFVGWTPDLVRFDAQGYAHRGNGWAYELSLRQPLGDSFAVSVGGGYYDQLFGVHYWAWNAGVSFALGPFELDLSRFGNDATARELYGRESAADRWALTALWRF